MKTDVLVIGGGLAGLYAAQEAAKRCKTLLLADGSGASPYIHGISVPLHSADSVELFIQDTLESGRYQNDSALVECFCRESAKIAKMFPFDKNGGTYELLKPLGASVPRVAGIGGRTGIHLIKQIQNEAKFTRMDGVRALKLACRGGRLAGAYCFDTKKKQWLLISAKAVVLASGGFSGMYSFSTNTRDSGGDGIAMAYTAGAVMRDMEFIQFEPTAAVYPKQLLGKSIITTMLYEGTVIRNKNGVRFMNERVNKDELSRGIFEEIKRSGATVHGGVYFDMTGVEKAALTGRYYDYYKRYADVGIDIAKTPVEIAPAPHTTLGGVAINAAGETSVAGLFACGEVTGGLHGANRLGGNAGLEVQVFGRLAGASAAAYAEAIPDVAELEFYAVDIDRDTTPLRRRLEAALDSGLSVIRTVQGIGAALEEVKELMKALENTGNLLNNNTNVDIKPSLTGYSYAAQRLYNDTLAAYIALFSAQERKESVGCHIRADGGEVAANHNSAARYTVTVTQKDGKMCVEKRDIQ